MAKHFLILLLLATIVTAYTVPAQATALVPLSTMHPTAYAATATANAVARATVTAATPTATATLQPAAMPHVQPIATQVDAYPATVATEWFKLMVRLTQHAPGFSPPVAARAYAYAGIALYEALVSGMPGYQSLSGQLSDMPAMPPPPAGISLYWPIVANSALATMARDLFPTVTDAPLRQVNALEARLHAQLATTATRASIAPSQAYGREVAAAIFAWSRSDGGDGGYMRNVDADYTQPMGEGLWQPTPPDYAPPMLPTWGQNRPLVPESPSSCAAPPPPAYSTDPTSQFYKEAREVYDSVRGLTPAQERIAYYWSDDAGSTATPPGHSLSIATQLLAQEERSLADAALLYARLGIALNDGFISCWETKYTWNVVRPITFIQAVIDPKWNQPEATDPVRTPPFPEYTSGHSVVSRAAAEILTATFGDNFRFTDITHVDRGMAPRTFSSFYAAADEAAISRLYGGIHYRSAIENGLAQGVCVGERVLSIHFQQP